MQTIYSKPAHTLAIVEQALEAFRRSGKRVDLAHAARALNDLHNQLAREADERRDPTNKPM